MSEPPRGDGPLLVMSSGAGREILPGPGLSHHQELKTMIHVESLTTGTPISTIIAQQNASSGMWAAGEGMEQLYLVPQLFESR